MLKAVLGFAAAIIAIFVLANEWYYLDGDLLVWIVGMSLICAVAAGLFWSGIRNDGLKRPSWRAFGLVMLMGGILAAAVSPVVVSVADTADSCASAGFAFGTHRSMNFVMSPKGAPGGW